MRHSSMLQLLNMFVTYIPAAAALHNKHRTPWTQYSIDYLSYCDYWGYCSTYCLPKYYEYWEYEQY